MSVAEFSDVPGVQKGVELSEGPWVINMMAVSGSDKNCKYIFPKLYDVPLNGHDINPISEETNITSIFCRLSPVFSGIATAIRVSPESALSDTNRNLFQNIYIWTNFSGVGR